MTNSARLAAFAALLAAGAAGAHALPRSADPAPGATLAASPTRIHIVFGEALVARFSGLDVTDGKGRKAAVGPAMIDRANARALVAPVREPLAPGVYGVNWRAVGDDTHRTTGHYSFTVAPR